MILDCDAQQNLANAFLSHPFESNNLSEYVLTEVVMCGESHVKSQLLLRVWPHLIRAVG